MSPTATSRRSTADASGDTTGAAAEVERLRRTFTGGRSRDISWRQRQLERLEALLTEREADIAAALADDLGRPPADAFIGDIGSTRAEARHARKHLRRWTRPGRVRVPLAQLPGRAGYSYEPRGVVLIIGPWNYPVFLTLGPLVAAIAAGNCAVLKPSEHAPATAAVLRRLVDDYLDTDAITVVEGGPETTQDLLDQRLDHAFFTGGGEVGKAVMTAAAKHLTPVTLELGGKCPVLVARDADLDVAARRVAWTKLMNSGQTCVAPDHVLVEESVRDDFVARLIDAVVDLSPPGTAGRDLPIVNERHARRIADLLASHGGTVAMGGTVTPEASTGDLTVVLDPEPTSAIMQEEIFGPLLPVVTVRSPVEAIQRVTAGPKPLAAYVFTESPELAGRFRTQVSAGAVVHNHVAVHLLVPELPFGGVGASGMGAYHGRWGFETFSHRKAYLSRPTRPDPRLLYPPYGALMRRVLHRLL